MQLRDAVEDDIPGILSIYNDVIATSTAIYAEKAVTLDERLTWFRLRQQQDYPFSSRPTTAVSSASSRAAIFARGLAIFIQWSIRSMCARTGAATASAVP
jgi:L-amino acid N-acyltransferase YncA